jgi:hypothetical protein
VNFNPASSYVNRIPDSVRAEMLETNSVSFSVIIRDTYCDFFLTNDTSFSGMLDKVC